jgi:hypothetical protein
MQIKYIICTMRKHMNKIEKSMTQITGLHLYNPTNFDQQINNRITTNK